MFGFGPPKLTREHVQKGDVKRVLRAFGGKKVVLDDLAMFASTVKVVWRPYARPEIHALFVRLYETGEQPLRYYATQILAYTQALDAVTRLISIMEQDEDTAVRECAVQCLEEFNTPAVREALLKACEHGDWRVSSSAAGILARWRERRAAAPIAARMLQLVEMKATGVVQIGRTMFKPFSGYRSALFDVADASNVDHLLPLIRHMTGHEQRMFTEMLHEKAPEKVGAYLRDQKLD